MRARPIAVLKMKDKGKPDEKVLCALVGDPRYAKVERAEQLGEAFLAEVVEFFRTYKRLEAGEGAVEVQGWGDVSEAHQILDAAFARYHQKFETQ